jgi:uncharacterized protein (DUF2141 family)
MSRRICSSCREIPSLCSRQIGTTRRASGKGTALAGRVILCTVLTTLLAIDARAATVEVHVKGVSVATGEIRASLCLPSEFVKKPCALRTHVSATVGETVLYFTGVAPGQYAISLYHDVNGNGRLDSDFIGRPTEPYGFSHDVKARFGAPKFKDAAIEVAEPGTVAVINLQHY